MRRTLLGAFIVGVVLIGLAAPAQTQSPTPDWRDGFRAHDRNGDGRIDRAEFQNWVVDGFYFRDKGRKGYLVQADLQGAASLEVFKAINRKGDGKLTLGEYLNALFVDFAAADADSSGTLSQDEIAAYIQRTGK